MSDDVTKPKGKFKGPGDPREIGRLGGRPRGSKNKPKEPKPDPLEGLNPRQRKYVQNIVQHGMSKTDAGTKAGYSLATSYAACANIETPKVKAALQALMLEAIPPEDIVRGVKAGTKATQTQIATADGKITDKLITENWPERRKYITLAASMAGIYTPRQEVDVTHHMSASEQIRILELGIKLGVDMMSPAERAALRRSYVSWCDACKTAHVEGEHIVTIDEEPTPAS